MVYLPKRNTYNISCEGFLRGFGPKLAGILLHYAAIASLLCGICIAGEGTPPITIPFLSTPPALADFLTMEPGTSSAQHMLKVSGFIQRNPYDGRPVSQTTEAYLGYDNKNLYVVFVCFDDPSKVRARRARREDILSDDNVEIMLDTFHDQRRAYMFQANPLGVQWDAIWTETSQSDSTSHFDTTFDTLWYSEGKLTARGYVVWMSIPFRSLRFSPLDDQRWGIILYRGIIRENEDAFWPAISSKLEGRLDRAVTAEGMQGISPGRNIQLIPYGLFNSFRTLNTNDPTNVHFDNRAAGGKIGLDSKFILRDSLVLDVTANPDFSQVESDDPQVTVNQRFEVFFPEKRPFFIENSDYFRTPIDLLFTRRIADPDFGARLSGRAGDYGLGLLVADDKAPGEVALPGDPQFGKRANFVIGRINRDILSQSSIGAIFTDREFDGSFNRVGGIDTRLKFSKTWTGALQGVVSSTRNLDGSYQAGPGYKADIVHAGLHLNYEGTYNDYSPGFVTEPGFVNRVDIRELGQVASYHFRPSNSFLVSWGPTLQTDQVWDHSGLRLDSYYQAILNFEFKRQTFVNFEPYVPFHERLRPIDFPSLTQNQDFNQHFAFVGVSSGYLSKLDLSATYNWSNEINFVPPASTPPTLAFGDFGSVGFTVRPMTGLKIDNTYLFSRLRDKTTGHAIFNNHIFRTRWNWQLTTALSLRAIVEYNTTLANPVFSSLQTTKQLSPQFLVTYLLHPGTAVYVGYNSDLQNIDPSLALDPNGALLRTRNRFINDNREFFVKVSYLFRF